MSCLAFLTKATLTMKNCRIMHLKMLPRREAMKMMLKHRDGFDAAQWAAVLCPSGRSQ